MPKRACVNQEYSLFIDDMAQVDNDRNDEHEEYEDDIGAYYSANNVLHKYQQFS